MITDSDRTRQETLKMENTSIEKQREKGVLQLISGDKPQDREGKQKNYIYM